MLRQECIDCPFRLSWDQVKALESGALRESQLASISMFQQNGDGRLQCGDWLRRSLMRRVVVIVLSPDFRRSLDIARLRNNVRFKRGILLVRRAASACQRSTPQSSSLEGSQ